ncbi:MAG: hypothetical protein K0B15_10980 [Lentimicrobium sp.]|nr:hypothetical protein [Lentimicrobium sp.]
MSIRLNDFTRFANSLLPHEVAYLHSINQFKDQENIDIINLILHNTLNPEQTFPYKTSIDKRKYSNLKIWINQRLKTADVDSSYEWLLEIDHKIMTDTISPKEEDVLIRMVRGFKKPPYYFLRFYEIIRNYRFYLLIRFRHYYNRIVDQFLSDYLELYKECSAVNLRLHEATIDIVNQYALNNADSRKWEEWLTRIFYNENLDGLNRYLAVVRLTLIYFNYREYDKLDRIYDDLDKMLKNGEFYSRRILLNYYSNRVMLHTRRNEPETALEYGFLSIRQHSNDYLHYVNNLCAVLLRQNYNARALKLMQDTFPELKHTRSNHNRVGFASFYIRALNKNNRASEAADYAETFLNGYKEQIFDFRWHTFFSAWLQSLILLEKYGRILQIAKRYGLMKREEEYRLRAVYIPTISWYHSVASYKELEINEKGLFRQLLEPTYTLISDPHKCRLMADLGKELHPHVPEIFHTDGTFRKNILPEE